MPASEVSRDEQSFETTQDHSNEAVAEAASLADNAAAGADKTVADKDAAGADKTVADKDAAGAGADAAAEADDKDAAGAEVVSPQAEDPAPAEADSSGETDAAEDHEEQLGAVAESDKKSSRRRFSRSANGGRRRARASSGGSSTSHRRTRGGGRDGAGSAGLTRRRPVFVAVAIAAVLAVGVTGLVMGVLAYVKAKDAQEESIRFSDVRHVEDALSEAANRYENMEEFFRQFNGKFRSGHEFDDSMGMKGWMGGKEGWMGGGSGPWGSMPGKGLEGDWGGWKEMPGKGLWGSAPGEGLEDVWGGWKEMPGKGLWGSAPGEGLEDVWGGWKEMPGEGLWGSAPGEGLEGDWGGWKEMPGEGLWGSAPGKGLEGDLDIGDFSEFFEMLGGLFGLSDSMSMEDWMGSDGMDELSDLAGANIPEGQLREMFEGVLESFQGNSTSLESSGLNCESDELTSPDSDDFRSMARWMLCEWSSETDSSSSAASTGRRT